MGVGIIASSVGVGFGLMWGIPFSGGGRGPEIGGVVGKSISESLSNSKREM